jgi:hypothetical protein
MASGTESLRDRIEKRAFALYQQRGGTHGYDFNDWLRAEREIMEQESGKIANVEDIKDLKPNKGAPSRG